MNSITIMERNTTENKIISSLVYLSLVSLVTELVLRKRENTRCCHFCTKARTRTVCGSHHVACSKIWKLTVRTVLVFTELANRILKHVLAVIMADESEQKATKGVSS